MKIGKNDPKIAILGVGQLGSRYVQGLLSGSNALNIWLRDPAINSRSAFDSWRNTYGIDVGRHFVRFSLNNQDSPDHFDLVISATTADVRYESLNAFLDGKTFDYLILEKVLTTGLEDLEDLAKLAQRGKECWVNHPMRLFLHYQKLKTELQIYDPIDMVVEGTDWNMASNSSHYCDLLRWLTNEQLVEIDCALIEREWRNSKRVSFLDFTGVLTYRFSEGSELVLRSKRIAENESFSPVKISIRSSLGHVTINEEVGTVRASWLEEDLKGDYLLQSNLTSNLVGSILATGQCGLPKFKDVRDDHALYLQELLAYRAKVHLNSSRHVRIT
jgi:hypothetical protein